MRELWARRIAFLTGQLILLFSAGFAIIHNPTSPPDRAEQNASQETETFIALDLQRIEAGQQVYQQQTCVRCHSIAGKGNPRNPLDGVGARRNSLQLRDWIKGADVLQGVLPERAFIMKQVYKELSSDDLDALVIYMQSLLLNSSKRKDQPAAVAQDSIVPAPTGEDRNCLTCHRIQAI